MQTAANITVREKLFAPCMVGTLESQLLKMFTKSVKAQHILDIGTFTGMSAIAFAEGSLAATCWEQSIWQQSIPSNYFMKNTIARRANV